MIKFFLIIDLIPHKKNDISLKLLLMLVKSMFENIKLDITPYLAPFAQVLQQQNWGICFVG